MLARLAAVSLSAAAAVDMGPLENALGQARGEWRKDACLSRLTFSRERNGERIDEVYRYTFYSASAWTEDLEFGDNGEFETLRTGGKFGGNRCLGTPGLDAKAALRIALRRGVPARPGEGFGLRATLDFVDGQEALQRRKAKTPSVFAKLEGTLYWHVRNQGRSVILDAGTGKVHYSGPILEEDFVATEPPPRAAERPK